MNTIDLVIKDIKDKLKEWEELIQKENDDYKELWNEYDFKKWYNIDWCHRWLEMALEIIENRFFNSH